MWKSAKSQDEKGSGNVWNTTQVLRISGKVVETLRGFVYIVVILLSPLANNISLPGFQKNTALLVIAG